MENYLESFSDINIYIDGQLAERGPVNKEYVKINGKWVHIRLEYITRK